MELETRLNDLPDDEYKSFFSSHCVVKLRKMNTSGFGNDKPVVGYYSRKELKIPFYFEPTWFSRQRMYWLYGWNWTWADEETNGE